MNYKIYENVFDDEFIEHFFSKLDTSQYRDGTVGRTGNLNVKQKKRKDLYITNQSLLSELDEMVYSKVYTDIKDNFSDIKYRERWKVGKYIGTDECFYNLHRDNSDETVYRNTSMVIALSDPDDYEGGEFCIDSLNFKQKFKKGSCMVFKSSLYHYVKPITSGERYVLISFFFDDVGKEVKKQHFPGCSMKSYIPLLTSMKISNYDADNLPLKPVSTLKGDIDYSDNNIKSWTDKDDYLFEDNNSDILLVTFAGMGWKQSIPTFIFHNFLKQYENVDKLFLRDINCRYYLTGLKNSTTNLHDTIDLIRSKVSVKDYKKIVGIGCSSGGYAAILFGQILNFDKIIAFSPQTVLNNKKEQLIGDIYNAPKTCKWLQTIKLNDELFHNSLDLNYYRPFRRSIDIHYSVNGNKGADKKHALYLEGPQCKLIEHSGNDHMIALTLRNNGKLKEIIDKEVLIDEDLDIDIIESNVEENIIIEIGEK